MASSKLVTQYWSHTKGAWGSARDADLHDTLGEASFTVPVHQPLNRKGWRIVKQRVGKYVIPTKKLPRDPYTLKSLVEKHNVHDQKSHGRTFFGHARGMWKPGNNETEVIVPIENPAHWAMERAASLENTGFTKSDGVSLSKGRGYNVTSRVNEVGVPEQVVTSWGQRDGLERHQQKVRYVKPDDMNKIVGSEKFGDWKAFNEKSLAKIWRK
jgi:hypothetical protein